MLFTSLVDDFRILFCDNHLFRVHLVFGQVFNVNLAEVAQTSVEGDVGKVDIVNFQTLHQLAAEVHAGGRRNDSAFVLSENTLVVFFIFRTDVACEDFLWKWSLSQSVQGFLEFVIWTIKQEAEGTSARGGVVYNLGNQRVVIAKVELVTNSYLAGWVYQHVPELHFAVQFAEKEYFNFSVGLFLVTVKACRENLRVVENEHVAIAKVFNYIFEYLVFNLTCLAVNHHQAAGVAVFIRVLCNKFLWKFEIEF